MSFVDRFRRLLEGMPDGASVSLPVGILRGWLEEAGGGSFEPDLTVKEVADCYGRSPARVRAWIREGQLRAYRFQNKEWRVPPSALEDFQKEQKGRG
jgi:excisionase family DNA binding protein